MPSSTSKQISYPCPLIGNAGDYSDSAQMIFKHVVQKFPKKLIFHFTKPEITDEKLLDLFNSGEGKTISYITKHDDIDEIKEIEND